MAIITYDLEIRQEGEGGKIRLEKIERAVTLVMP
jgi:hypothetical protein